MWTSSPYFEAAYSLLNNEKFISSAGIAFGTIRIDKMKIPDEVLHHKIKPNILGALEDKEV